MSDRVYTQDEVFTAVRRLLKKYHAERAILFGSYARQEADASSDIDLIVIGGSRFDPTDVFCIAEELHRTLGKPVDVYELRELNAGSAFYDTVMAEGVQIAWSTATSRESQKCERLRKSSCVMWQKKTSRRIGSSRRRPFNGLSQRRFITSVSTPLT